jgi:U32 family peptidase
MKKEILAPVGSYEAFFAAVQAGADAVYLAGKSFGARAYADNFTNEDIASIITYAHIRDVLVYVTINTLMFDDEIDELMTYVDFLYHHDVDAVIVQDIGVCDLIHQKYPTLDIHASTQMNVHSVSEAKMLKELGVKRIVLARETELDQINKIYQETGLEIEAFVHGALCQSYSGQCLLSSLIGKRSGNRGKCAQPCRLPYQLKSDAKDFSNEYYLSMKDLMTLDSLEAIINSNIVSLKIEGRMKRPEYVFLVVGTYKKAIQNYYNTGSTLVCEEDITELKKIFNREFTKGYILDENFGKVVNIKRPNHMGTLLGTVINYKNGYARVKLIDDLQLQDGIRFVGNSDVGMAVLTIFQDGMKVNSAQSGSIVELIVNETVQNNDSVYKTTDSVQLRRLKVDTNKEIKKVNITGTFKAMIGEQAELIIRDERDHVVVVTSSQVVVAASKPDLDISRYVEQIHKLGNTPFIFANLETNIDQNAYISIKEINELRRIAIEELIELRKMIHHRTHQSIKQYEVDLTIEPSKQGIRVSCHTLDQLDAAISCGIEEIYYDDIDTYEIARTKKSDLIMYLPRIDFDDDIIVPSSQVVVSELGNMKKQIGKYVITDLYMNITNHHSVSLLHRLGVNRITLSPEVSYNQMKQIIDAYQRQFHHQPNLEVVVYGFYEAMIMRHCVISSSLGINQYDCKACYHNQYQLVDRLGYQFQLMRGYQCSLKMLNARRLSLLDQIHEIYKLGVASLRIQLTLESKEETTTIIKAFLDKQQGLKAMLPFQDMTYGHFKERIE